MFRMMRATLCCAWVALACLAGCGGGAAKGAPNGDDLPAAQLVASSITTAAWPDLVAAPDDSVWMAWAQVVPGGESVFAARIDAEGRVSSSVITPTPAYARRQVFIAAAGGTPLVAWLEIDQNSDRSVKVAAWTGSAWVIEQTVVPINSAGAIADARLISAVDGRAHLVWSEDRGISGTGLYGMRRAASGAWEAVQTIRTVPTGTRGHLRAIAADPVGSVMAMWTEEPDGGGAPMPQDLLASRFDPVQGVWSASVQVDGASRFGDVQLVSGRAGEWVVAFMDVHRTPFSLWSMRYLSGSWQYHASGIAMQADTEPREIQLTADQTSATIAWIWQSTVFAAQDSGVRATRLEWAGGPFGQWGTSTALGEVSSSWGRLRLRQGSGGQQAAAWFKASGNGDPWLALSDGVGVWAPAMRIEPPQHNGYGTDAVFTSSGAWVVMWGRDNLRKTDLMVRRFR